jgi:hypothetical protein
LGSAFFFFCSSEWEQQWWVRVEFVRQFSYSSGGHKGEKWIGVSVGEGGVYADAMTGTPTGSRVCRGQAVIFVSGDYL